MAYDIYTLTGFVIDVRDIGEYDKKITFFSEEYGIINVAAIGAGKSASKLRGFLVRFCKINIDVVHGKTGYRLIRASALDNGFLIHKKEAYFTLLRFTNLLKYLLPESVPHPESFNILSSLVSYLEKNLILNEKIDKIFYYSALNLFSQMGYRNKLNKINTHSDVLMQKEYESILEQNGLTNVI